MRVCKIWDADYPWDIRVEKVVLSLVEAGHSVDLVCRNSSGKARVEKEGKFTIRRLPKAFQQVPLLHSMINLPFPLNPFWIWTIFSAVRASRAEVILVRDLPLALPAAVLGKLLRIPVVFDMAEHYPAMLEDRLRYTPTGLAGKIARHPGIAWLVERWTLCLVDHTIVVVEESRDRLVEAGYPIENISVVGNTPKVEQWTGQEEAGGRTRGQDSVSLVYLGNLDGIRGIDIAIQAIGILKDRGVRAALRVIGDGPNRKQLERLTEQLGLTDRVEFLGRLALNDAAAMARVKEVMANSQIGLIPHYATEACNATVPNKLFDYMTMGLPVVVSDMKPTARIVDEERCGAVFKDRDPESLAACVQSLADPEIRRQMGMNGLRAIRRRYHWEYDAATLVRTMETVAKKGAA